MSEGDSLWTSEVDLPNSDGDAVCRVCHGESEESRPLFHPCRCDGSIKFVHSDCLLEWLRVSKRVDPKCELCGEQFSFRRVYAENAPSQLSVFEFIGAVAPRVGIFFSDILRWLFLITLWIFMLPIFISCWMDCWTSFLLTGSFSWSFRLLATFSVELLSLWWNGIVICSGIILATLGIIASIMYIQEEIFGWQPAHDFMAADDPQLNGGVVAGSGDEGAVQLGGLGEGEEEVGQEESGHPSSLRVEEAEGGGVGSSERAHMLELQQPETGLSVFQQEEEERSDGVKFEVVPSGAGIAAELPSAISPCEGGAVEDSDTIMESEVVVEGSAERDAQVDPCEEEEKGADEMLHSSAQGRELEGGGFSAGSEETKLEEEDDTHPPLPPPLDDAEEGFPPEAGPPPRAIPPADGGGGLPGPAGGNRGRDAIMMDDLRWMFAFNGPLLDMLWRPVAMGVCIAIFICLVEVLPVLMGRVVLSLLGFNEWGVARVYGAFKHQIPLNDAEEDSVATATMNMATGVLNILSGVNTVVIGNVTRQSLVEGLGGESSLAALFHRFSSVPSEYAALRAIVIVERCVGYAVVMSVLLIGIMYYFSFGTGRIVFTRLCTRLQSRGEVLGADFKNGCKLYVYLAFELVFIPYLVGLVIDVVTLKIFGADIEDRIALFKDRPFLFNAVHYFVGLFFVVHVQEILTEVRRVMKRGVLTRSLPECLFFRDENAIRALGLQPVGSLVEMHLLNLCYYIPSILLAVMIPSKIGHVIIPFAGPLQLQFESFAQDVQLPLELLVFHFVFPLLITKYHHREVMRFVVHRYLIWACDFVGLSDDLLDAEVVEETLNPGGRDGVRIRMNVPVLVDINVPGEVVAGANALAVDEITREEPGDEVENEIAEVEIDETDGDGDDSQLIVGDDSAGVEACQPPDLLPSERCREGLDIMCEEEAGEDRPGKALELDNFALDRLSRTSEEPVSEMPNLLDRVISAQGVYRHQDEEVVSEEERVQEQEAAGQQEVSGQEVASQDEVVSEEERGEAEAHLGSNVEYSNVESDAASPPSGSSSAGVDDRQIRREEKKALRYIMLSTISMGAVVGLFSWIIHMPFLVGRFSLKMLGITIANDLYSLALGFTVLVGGFLLAEYVVTEVSRNSEYSAFFSMLWKWLVISGKCVILGSIWFSVVPLLLGVLLEAVFLTPWRTPWDESPSYPLVQSWAIGLLFLKAWLRLILVGALGESIWRDRFERVLRRGFLGVEFFVILRNIILPIIVALLDMILIPYFVARMICLASDWNYLQRSLIVRFSFACYVGMRACWFGLVSLKTKILSMHNEIRDSRYLLGTELKNR